MEVNNEKEISTGNEGGGRERERERESEDPRATTLPYQQTLPSVCPFEDK